MAGVVAVKNTRNTKRAKVETNTKDEKRNIISSMCGIGVYMLAVNWSKGRFCILSHFRVCYGTRCGIAYIGGVRTRSFRFDTDTDTIY